MALNFPVESSPGSGLPLTDGQRHTENGVTFVWDGTVWNPDNPVDADTLNGNAGSFYRNYNNLTNRPTIPDVTSFLNQSEVDARVSVGVLDWAETGNSTTIPAAKISDEVIQDIVGTNAGSTGFIRAGGSVSISYDDSAGTLTITGASVGTALTDDAVLDLANPSRTSTDRNSVFTTSASSEDDIVLSKITSDHLDSSVTDLIERSSSLAVVWDGLNDPTTAAGGSWTAPSGSTYESANHQWALIGGTAAPNTRNSPFYINSAAVDISQFSLRFRMSFTHATGAANNNGATQVFWGADDFASSVTTLGGIADGLGLWMNRVRTSTGVLDAAFDNHLFVAFRAQDETGGSPARITSNYLSNDGSHLTLYNGAIRPTTTGANRRIATTSWGAQTTIGFFIPETDDELDIRIHSIGEYLYLIVNDTLYARLDISDITGINYGSRFGFFGDTAGTNGNNAVLRSVLIGQLDPVNAFPPESPNTVTLGDNTVGDYVSGINGTTNEIEVTGSGGENATVTLGLPDNVTIGNNLTVTGNLVINGTTTTVDSTTITIDDAIFTLGRSGLTAADTHDRGIEFRYYDNADSRAEIGFFGWDQSANEFIAVRDATNTSEAFTGTFLNARFGTVTANLTGNVTGNLTGNASTASNAAQLTTARTIALTGPVTGSTSFNGSANASIATTLTVADHFLTLAKLPEIASDRILGRNDTGTGDVEALTGAEVRALANSQKMVTVADTAPASPDDGDIWLNSDTARLFYRYKDTDSSQWIGLFGIGGGGGPAVWRDLGAPEDSSVAITNSDGDTGDITLRSSDTEILVVMTGTNNFTRKYTIAIPRAELTSSDQSFVIDHHNVTGAAKDGRSVGFDVSITGDVLTFTNFTGGSNPNNATITKVYAR